jgi:hypothetical protein
VIEFLVPFAELHQLRLRVAELTAAHQEEQVSHFESIVEFGEALQALEVPSMARLLARGEKFKRFKIKLGADEPGRCICGRGPGGPEWGGAGTCIHCNRVVRDLDADLNEHVFERLGGVPGQRVDHPDTGELRLCKCGKPVRPFGSYTWCSWACVDAPAVPAPEGMEWVDSEFVTKLVLFFTRREVARIYITSLTRTANTIEVGNHRVDVKHDGTVPGAKRAIVAYLADRLAREGSIS